MTDPRQVKADEIARMAITLTLAGNMAAVYELLAEAAPELGVVLLGHLVGMVVAGLRDMAAQREVDVAAYWQVICERRVAQGDD